MQLSGQIPPAWRFLVGLPSLGFLDPATSELVSLFDQ